MAEASWDAISLHHFDPADRQNTFEDKCIESDERQTISTVVGRIQMIWHEPSKSQHQTTRQTILYVPLPLFVFFAAVEIRRRMSSGPSRCRNPLNYVERQCKLLVLWRKARNTPKLSNTGSLRPKTASHNGAGKSQQRKPASCAPCG